MMQLSLNVNHLLTVCSPHRSPHQLAPHIELANSVSETHHTHRAPAVGMTN